MEEDEIQEQVSKFPRIENGSTFQTSSWHQNSSRIVRVSRASGGKDRHSKVMTSKGLRDRRVRLSVTTAIEFYDLQDRLGYDQPSKAVEWLIKSAADAIAKLPSLPETPSVGTEQQGFENDSPDAEGAETNIHHQQNQNQNQSQNLSLSKSGCSSTSETSKGSGLSLSRSDIRVNRVKARERARERASKEKEKEKESDQSHIAQHQHQHQHQHQNVNPISQTASFTELLTGGISNAVPTTTSSPREWCSSSSAPMDYFNTGLLGPSSSSSRTHHSSGFSFSQIQLGHSHSLAEAMSVSLPFSGENHHSSASDQLHQQFSFIPDHHHLMPEPAVVTSSSTPSQNSGNHYDLNFTISSGLAGFNRGTLQSNSPSAATALLPHHLQQRFSHLDGSTVPFLLGAAAAAPPHAAAPAMENHHQLQFSPVFDGGSLQLCYGDGCRHSDQKPKAKN